MSDSEHFWYVLNYIAPVVSRNNSLNKYVDRFNASFGTSVEVFAPTFIEMVREGDKLKVVEKPLLYHYVFIKTDIEHVKRFCNLFEGFSFVLDRASEKRYLTISDSDINSFRIIAQFYGNRLPYYKTECIELEEGDEVEVIDGDFSGLKGTFISRKGSSKGNIIVSVSQTLASIAYDIKPEHVRILRFAKNSKRAYDQIDAIVPKLLHALRKYSGNERLSAAEISPLAVFCRRFEVVRLDNSKMQAKLMAMLMAANKILGNNAGYEEARAQYEKYAGRLTNRWTLALIYLLQALTGESDSFKKGYDLMKAEGEKASKFQQALKAEYEYHLNNGFSGINDR